MRENPSLLLTAHFHNWEFLGSFLHRKRVPLLAAARARGHITTNGLGMLLHQAVPAFESWFGVKPEITEALRQEILATF